MPSAKSIRSSPRNGTNQSVGHIDRDGYRRVYRGGKQVLEHRWIVEESLGRKLLPGEVVHHANGQRLDNRPANLQVLERGEHMRLHLPLGWSIEAAVALLREGVSMREVAKRVGRHHASVRSPSPSSHAKASFTSPNRRISTWVVLITQTGAP